MEIDFIFAKSRLADKMHAVEPILTDDGIIRLKKARHPMILKNIVVPTDIYLGESFDTLIITGPNTGENPRVIYPDGNVWLDDSGGGRKPDLYF